MSKRVKQQQLNGILLNAGKIATSKEHNLLGSSDNPIKPSNGSDLDLLIVCN